MKNQLTKLLSLLLCYWAFHLRITPVAAQSITPAADGTGTIINHNGNTYNIDGGTQAGANLFHSFAEFGLTPDEIANFLSNPQIDNILGRVTGGNPSVIQGLIQLTEGNSNLYLMNPNGWVFGQEASLDVPGSFAATTATRIGFGEGFFNAYGENDFSNLAGNPTSFVFDTETGLILNEGDLEVGEGQSLWLIGNSVISTGTLEAPGGNVTIAAVPGNKQIRLSQEGMVVELVLDAAPLTAGEYPQQIGLRAVDIPRYLTGGNQVGHAK
ncbi:MAG: filamentous hemagglutinin N-terminal domain-containing protein, partial [Symploca sp. SIO3E6]|nr:filamentous hemagglutinin N-terminal domain-containing protein [Caldora sp. SIO3E6]